MRYIGLFLAALFMISCGGDTSNTAQVDDQMFPVDDYAGAHILVAYEGAQRADPGITRTKEEALAKAQELIDELTAAPETFAAVAQRESDGPSAADGGDLGTWQRGQMVPAFDEAIAGLEVGGITPEPVETQFGYHVIMRKSNKIPHYTAFAFVVSHSGVPQVDSTLTRTAAEAEALAEDLGSRINGSNFDDLAEQYNDMGSGPEFMGVVTKRDQLPDSMLAVLSSLQIGEAGGPIPIPMGYLFVKRAPVEQHAGSHILIMYQGAMRADPSITRSKEEAYALASSLLDSLNGSDQTFEAFAQEHSEGPSATTGGDLGVWFKGMMVPEFDQALEEIEVGAVTDEPVESPFGYHIIRRNAVPE